MKSVFLLSVTKKLPDKINEQLLNVQKAATFLDVNRSTIRKWAQQGKLQGLKIGSRGDWRFTKEELLKMIKPNVGKITTHFR